MCIECLSGPRFTFCGAPNIFLWRTRPMRHKHRHILWRTRSMRHRMLVFCGAPQTMRHRMLVFCSAPLPDAIPPSSSGAFLSVRHKKTTFSGAVFLCAPQMFVAHVFCARLNLFCGTWAMGAPQRVIPPISHFPLVSVVCRPKDKEALADIHDLEVKNRALLGKWFGEF